MLSQQTLAAVAQHVGGVMPAHVHFDDASNTVSQTWLWATGAHPLTYTGLGNEFSQMHVDSVHRSYIITTLDHSILSVNEAVAVLAKEVADDSSFELYRKLPLAALAKEREALERLWQEIVDDMKRLEYMGAMKQLPAIEKHSHRIRFAFANSLFEPSVALRGRICDYYGPSLVSKLTG